MAAPKGPESEPDLTVYSLDKCLIHFKGSTWGAQMFDVTRQNVRDYPGRQVGGHEQRRWEEEEKGTFFPAIFALKGATVLS